VTVGGHNGDDESRRHRVPPRPIRGNPSFGRRRSDMKLRDLPTRKALVVAVFLIDALYLAGEAILFGQNVCP